ncbi:MAG: hypothetical protein WD767_04010 [Alphaproteobacteria bacterium]
MAKISATSILSAMVIGFCLVWPLRSFSQTDRPIMLSAVIDAPVMLEPEGRGYYNPQPQIGAVTDALIPLEGGGQIKVILSVEEPEIIDADGVIIPWNELYYDIDRKAFLYRGKPAELGKFDRYYGPVSGTLGVRDGVLASKLFSADILLDTGENSGSVADIALARDGEPQRLLYSRGAKTASRDWATVRIRRERPYNPVQSDVDAVIELDGVSR